MPNEIWSTVDQYFNTLLLPPDSVLDAIIQANADAELPPYDVTPNQGRLLNLLARLCGARNVLEVGTLGGYSAVWLARALPDDGCLITLELDAKHAQVAVANIEMAGLADIVELRQGPALDSLAALESEGCSPFDLIFIDADKESNPEYFEYALKFSRRGTLIVVDNVVRDGAIMDLDNNEPGVQGIRRLAELITGNPRVDATVVQTVGSKGYDGLMLAVVNEA